MTFFDVAEVAEDWGVVACGATVREPVVKMRRSMALMWRSWIIWEIFSSTCVWWCLRGCWQKIT